MTSLLIRPASLQDAASIAELSEQLGYPSTEQDLQDRLASLLKRSDHLVLAAVKDGKVVGWIHAFIAWRVESSAFVEIGGLVVAQSERSGGIGRRLVRAASNWAHKNGFEKIRVRSNIVRDETHQFYVHLGFEALKSQTVFSMATNGE